MDRRVRMNSGVRSCIHLTAELRALCIWQAASIQLLLLLFLKRTIQLKRNGVYHNWVVFRELKSHSKVGTIFFLKFFLVTSHSIWTLEQKLALQDGHWAHHLNTEDPSLWVTSPIGYFPDVLLLRALCPF